MKESGQRGRTSGRDNGERSPSLGADNSLIWGQHGGCYTSQQTYVEVKILTLREVLMKRHCVLKARQRLEQEMRGTRSQLR